MRYIRSARRRSARSVNIGSAVSTIVWVPVLALVVLSMSVSLEPVSTGVTPSLGAEAAEVAGVRVGGIGWLQGVRVGDPYVRWPTDTGGEITTLAGDLGLADVARQRPWLPWVSALVAVTAAFALRGWLPGVASVLLVGTSALLTWDLLGVVVVPLALLVVAVPTVVLWAVALAARRSGGDPLPLAVAPVIAVGMGGLLVATPDTWRSIWAMATVVPVCIVLAATIIRWMAAIVASRRAGDDPIRPLWVSVVGATTAGRAVLWNAHQDWREDRARWLHDTVLPQLSSGIRDVETGRTTSGSTTLHGLARDLRGDLEADQLTVLRVGGLAEALGDALAAAEEHGFECDLRVDETEVTPPWPVVMGAWRVAQEAISNAQRHSRGDRIDVRLEIGRDHLRLEVADDGVGLPDDGRTRKRGHVGLQAMDDAAMSAGARLTLQSAHPSGLRVRIEWPG